MVWGSAGEELQTVTRWVLHLKGSTGDDDVYVGEVVLDHFFEVAFHFVGQHIEGSLRVVQFAVVPDQLQVVKHVLNSTVLSAFEFVLHSQQVHGVFHHDRVIIQLQFYFSTLLPSQSTGWMNSPDSGKSMR